MPGVGNLSVDLELMAAPDRSSRRRCRQDGRRSRGTGGRRARLRRNHDKKTIRVARRCVETLRGKEKARRLGRYTFGDPGVEALRERVRRRASGSAAPAAAAEVGASPGEECAREGLRRRERSANEKKYQMSLRTIISIFTYHTSTAQDTRRHGHHRYLLVLVGRGRGQRESEIGKDSHN